MNRFFVLTRAASVTLFVVVATLVSNSTKAQDENTTLTIGSKAPDLDIEHWISDNDGLFQHTTSIETGKIYVIDFWASWCAPCVAAMPELAELQKKFSDDNVQVISVSDEDLETIEDFLKRRVRDDQAERTYGELTHTYCLTTDPDKSVKKDYFRGAKQFGIPCSFIIGKTGLVEWIGPPKSLEKPLKQVIDDQWDRDSFVVKFNRQQEQHQRATAIRLKMIQTMGELQEYVNKNEPGKAVSMIDELMTDSDFQDALPVFKSMRLQIMINANLEGAHIALKEFTEEHKDDGQALNTIAWGIYQKYVAGGNVSRELLEQTKITAECAVEAIPESGAILDTLAHMIYVVDRDLDKAIEVQKRAVKYGGVQVNSLKLFLAQLEREKNRSNRRRRRK